MATAAPFLPLLKRDGLTFAASSVYCTPCLPRRTRSFGPRATKVTVRHTLNEYKLCIDVLSQNGFFRRPRSVEFSDMPSPTMTRPLPTPPIRSPRTQISGNPFEVSSSLRGSAETPHDTGCNLCQDLIWGIRFKCLTCPGQPGGIRVDFRGLIWR